MKCHKCGFVSYPGLTQCKRCGHRFVPTKREEPASGVLSLFSGSPVPGGPRAAPPGVEPPQPSAAPPQPVTSPPREPASHPVIVVEEALAAALPKPWQEEVSERVEDFRRRRARVRGEHEASPSLEFDFENAESPTAEFVAHSPLPEPAHPGLDLEIEPRATPEFDVGRVDAVPLHPKGAGSSVLDSAILGDAEFPPERSYREPHRVEIVLEPLHSPAAVSESELSLLALPVAPMGRRFAAGILDALVLMAAAGVFALIFWRAGDRMSPHPLNLAVVGLITVIFFVAYFGLFTALTSTTPGLLWMGLEVRNLEGGLPTPREAFLRAFGYLVSAAALLLGFIWALVDSDEFTWHDRMSGTYLMMADTDHRHVAQPGGERLS